MCQLNVFLISKKIPFDSVMNLMTSFGIEGDCITEEFKTNELSANYNFYISPTYKCHCSSFVTKFSNKQYEHQNLVDMLTKQHKDELSILNDMKAFISRRSYPKERESFLKIYNELQPKVINTENEIFKKYGGSSDFQTKIKDEMNKSTIHMEFRALLSENSMMYDSLMHYTKSFNATADDLDEQIEKAKIENFKYEYEYIQLKSWILNVLDKYGEVKFFSYWQDNSELQIHSTREITAAQISFDLFAKLKYGELLNITFNSA
mgnify:CR=1 FL=1